MVGPGAQRQPNTGGSKEQLQQRTAPGIKRLLVIASAVAYVVCLGIPVWWQTTSLHRPPLPHDVMQQVAVEASSSSAFLPVTLQLVVVLQDGHEAADTSQLAAALHSSVQSAVTNNEQLSVQLSTTVTTKRGGCQHHPAAPAGKSAPSLPTACTADWAAAAQHLTSAGGSSTRSQQQLDQWLLQLQQQAVQHTGGSAALHGAAAGQYILYLLPLHDSSTHPSTDSTDSSSGGSLIVGRHRHAWLTYDPTQLLQQQQLESTAAAATIKVLSCCFGMHAGPAGLTTAGSLPISPAGQTVLSFSLLNADPAAGSHFTWDMESWEAQHLAPVAASLVSVTQVTVESQVLQYTPARLQGQWSDKHAAYVVKGSQLPFFLDSEWALEPGRAVTPREGSPGVAATAAAGEVPLSSAGTGARAAAMLVEPHVLQFVVYVPPPQQRPLQLLGRKGKLRDSNSYVIPAWGGLMVLNPDAQAADSSSSSSAAGGSRPAAAVPLTAEQSQEIAAVVIAQLQALFGVAPAATDITTSSSSGSSSAGGALEVVVLPAGRSGFSGWQVDALLRQRSGHDVREAARVLAALSTLVQELPNLEMPDLIGEQVSQALSAINSAWQHTAAGNYIAAAAAATSAHAAAEAAFSHPAVLAQLNFPESHKLGVYMPLFLPLCVPLIQGLMGQLVYYSKQRRRHRQAGLARQ